MVFMLFLYMYQEIQLKENIQKTGYSILNALVTDTRYSLQKGERNVFQGVLDKISSLENVQSVSLYTPDKLKTYKSDEITVGLPFLKINKKLINPNEKLYVKTNGSYLRDDWSYSENTTNDHSTLIEKYDSLKNIKFNKCSKCHYVINKDLKFDATRKTHIINEDQSYFYYNIPVEKNCISCHAHWKIGKSAGYLEINMNNKNLTSQSHERLKYFFIILVVVIFSFVTIGYFIKALNKKLQSTQTKLEDQVNHDSMTNLYNRRYLYQASKQLIKNSDNLNLIMFDIDNFKNINDSYGHDIGDKVIISLAKEVLRCTRKSDISARWGGEEFLILLPDTNKEGSKIIAEKIRANIETLQVEKIHFTVSVGVSYFDYNRDKNIDDAIKRADLALYEAKSTGKNRICYM